MPKYDVWGMDAPEFPVHTIQITGLKGKVWDFYLHKLDAFEDTQQQDLYRRLCDAYLGIPIESDKRTGKVVKRAQPTEYVPLVGNKRIKINEDVLWVASKLYSMQDFDGHAKECYDQAIDMLAIAAIDKGVYEELWARALLIDQSAEGNACEEEEGDKSAQQ